MTFEFTPLDGVRLLRTEPHGDDRGWFARLWCAQEMREQGLAPTLSQLSLSFNARAGTLRGMHFQAEPHAENKLVRCLAGVVHDVVLDLRPASATYRRWFAAELSAANGMAMYVPAGCAHGFQTLSDAVQVFYCIDTPYEAASARRVRYNDSAFGIAWPRPVTVISPLDAECPDFQR